MMMMMMRTVPLKRMTNTIHRRRHFFTDTRTKTRQPLNDSGYEYDLVVIGGGSGGMAAAKEASRLGAKVANFDYVEPTPRGISWGLGGTCVNVGCVPKKIMHYAASFREVFSHANNLGWNATIDDFTWKHLIETTSNHVRSTSFSYSNALRSADVEYINAEARLEGQNTITYDTPVSFLSEELVSKKISSKYILLAVGSRPHIMKPDWYSMFESVITSDDLFWMDSSPGKTLVIGAGYVALESASFLNAFGFDTTVCVRSQVLRGFDEDCSTRVRDLMECTGVKFRQGVEPSNIVSESDDVLRVHFDNDSEVFDTVLLATGRRPRTFNLGLETLFGGIDKLKPTGHLVTDDEDRVVGDVYAVGDVVFDSPELTPYVEV
jgi:thioredoxin reductase (NADPH)